MKKVYPFLFLFIVLLLAGKLVAQPPVYTYNFAGTLNEAGSGPALTPVGGSGSFVTNTVCGVSKTVYQFAAGQGLNFPVGATFTNTYSIEIVFRFNAVFSYARVLDYKSLTTDDGLYVVGGNLNFYPVSSGSGSPINAGTYVHVVLTRNAAGIVNGYVDGNPHLSFVDGLGRALTDVNNNVIFFKDDGSENSAGAVSLINIYNIELTPADVAAKYAAACPPPPPIVYTYKFDGTFNEHTGMLPSLQPIGTGSFTTEVLPCGQTRGVYNFDFNCGVLFDNNLAANPIGAEHTIELYFKFQNLTSWKRIVDYKNRTSDTGPYAYNSQIQFYNVVTSSTFPFSPGVYAHVVLTRSNTSPFPYNMYVDGVLRATFNDFTALGVMNASNLLRFFQDDLVVQNEASPGTIALLRLYNYVVTPATVTNLYNEVINCPLDANQVTLLPIRSLGNQIQLQWTHTLSEAAVTGFELMQHTNVATNDIITGIPANAKNLILATPGQQVAYQIAAILTDGSKIVSNTVYFRPAFAAEDAVRIYPNPCSSENITVELPENAHKLALFDVQNRLLKTLELKDISSNSSINLPVNGFPDGSYHIVVYRENKDPIYQRMIIIH
jgi:hypothetical protein